MSPAARREALYEVLGSTLCVLDISLRLGVRAWFLLVFVSVRLGAEPMRSVPESFLWGVVTER